MLNATNMLELSGKVRIFAQPCCETCEDSAYTFQPPKSRAWLSFDQAIAKKLETYEIASPDNGTLPFGYPSCDGKDVSFKTYVNNNVTGLGASDGFILTKLLTDWSI